MDKLQEPLRRNDSWGSFPDLDENGVVKEGTVRGINLGDMDYEQFYAIGRFIPGSERPKVSKLRDSQYVYNTLQELETDMKELITEEVLNGKTPSMCLRNQRFVFGYVTEICPANQREYNAYHVRISDETMKDDRDVLLRIHANHTYRSMGPTINVGNVIRVHRVTAQVEYDKKDGGLHKLVLSTTPHHNYTLFSFGEDGRSIVYNTCAKTVTLSDCDTRRAFNLLKYFCKKDQQHEEQIIQLGNVAGTSEQHQNSEAVIIPGRETTSVPVSRNRNCEPHCSRVDVRQYMSFDELFRQQYEDKDKSSQPCTEIGVSDSVLVAGLESQVLRLTAASQSQDNSEAVQSISSEVSEVVINTHSEASVNLDCLLDHLEDSEAVEEGRGNDTPVHSQPAPASQNRNCETHCSRDGVHQYSSFDELLEQKSEGINESSQSQPCTKIGVHSQTNEVFPLSDSVLINGLESQFLRLTAMSQSQDNSEAGQPSSTSEVVINTHSEASVNLDYLLDHLEDKDKSSQPGTEIDSRDSVLVGCLESQVLRLTAASQSQDNTEAGQPSSSSEVVINTHSEASVNMDYLLDHLEDSEELVQEDRGNGTPVKSKRRPRSKTPERESLHYRSRKSPRFHRSPPPSPI